MTDETGLSNLCHDNAVTDADAMSLHAGAQVTALIVRLHLPASDHDCHSVTRIYKHYFSALDSVLVIFTIW